MAVPKKDKYFYRIFIKLKEREQEKIGRNK